MLNDESSKYFNQIFCIGGTANRHYSQQIGDHRCLIEKLYNKHFKDQPNDEILINFLKNVDTNELVNFLNETFSILYSPWCPIVESK